MPPLVEPIKIAELNRELKRLDDFGRRLLELERQVRFNQERIPRLVGLKTNALGSEYTTTSTSFVDVDATTFNFATFVPNEHKLLCLASVSAFRANTTGEQTAIRLNDSITGQIAIMYALQSGSSANQSSAMQGLIIGDDKTHSINFQYRTASGTGTSVIHRNDVGAVVLTYLLLPNRL